MKLTRIRHHYGTLAVVCVALISSAAIALHIFDIRELFSLGGSSFSPQRHDTFTRTIYFSVYGDSTATEDDPTHRPKVRFQQQGFEDIWGQSRDRSPIINFLLPPTKTGAAVVVSDLWIDGKTVTCVAGDGAPRPDDVNLGATTQAGGALKYELTGFDPKSAEFQGKRFYILEFPPANTFYSVSCRVQNMIQASGYAGRNQTIAALYGGMPVKIYKDSKLNYDRYTGLFKLKRQIPQARVTQVEFDIGESEGFSLVGGRVDQHTDPSTSRLLGIGDEVSGKWNNPALLKIREILSMILGTFVGVIAALTAELFRTEKGGSGGNQS